MSFNHFTKSLNKKFQELGSKTKDIPTLAQTSQRRVQEKLGHVTDISVLPEDYVDLEKQVESIKLVYDHFLRITSVFENESYDYPKDVRESLSEFHKNFHAKLHERNRSNSLTKTESNSSANSPIPVSSNNGNFSQPKNLNGALAKASSFAYEQLQYEPDTAEKYNDFANAQLDIANAKLRQDKTISSSFNFDLRDILQKRIYEANKKRKEVHNKRLQYDIARTKLEQAPPAKKDQLRPTLEQAKHEFEKEIAETKLLMEQVVEHAHLLSNLEELANAQLEYHLQATKSLTQFLTLSQKGPSEPLKPTKNNAIPIDEIPNTTKPLSSESPVIEKAVNQPVEEKNEAQIVSPPLPPHHKERATENLPDVSSPPLPAHHNERMAENLMEPTSPSLPAHHSERAAENLERTTSPPLPAHHSERAAENLECTLSPPLPPHHNERSAEISVGNVAELTPVAPVPHKEVIIPPISSENENFAEKATAIPPAAAENSQLNGTPSRITNEMEFEFEHPVTAPASTIDEVETTAESFKDAAEDTENLL